MGRRTTRALGLLALVLGACASGAPTRVVPPASGTGRTAEIPQRGGAEAPPPLFVDDAPIPFDATPLVEPVKPAIAIPPPRSLAQPPRVTGHALPLRAAQIANLARDVEAKKSLWDPARVRAPLLRDGMVVIDAKDAPERFSDAYQTLQANGVPVLVTVDSLLHLYHVYFDQILRAIEVRVLSPMLSALLDATYDEVVRGVAHAGGALRTPALVAIGYLSVARTLLEPSFRVHPDVAEGVAADVQRILSHVGPDVSDAMSTPHCEHDCYLEDFSQYVPRGHYDTSPELRRYFRAQMWLGRIVFRFARPAEVAGQTLLLQALGRARVDFGGQKLTALDVLSRIDHLLDYFVGETDDLGVFEVSAVLSREIAAGSDLRSLVTPERAQRLSQSLRALRAPRILSNIITKFAEDPDSTIEANTHGLRLLGQRYAADSDLLGRLVFEFTGPDPRHPRFAEVAKSVKDNPHDDSQLCDRLTPAQLAVLDHPTCENLDLAISRCVCMRSVVLHGDCHRDARCDAAHPEAENEAFSQVCRLMPSGLDVMSVLGSARAAELSRPAESYCHYEQRLRQMSEHWRKNPVDTLYGDWLEALRPLVTKPGAGYPTWMRGSAFQNQSLTTALAAWSELRHDTLLYVKQSYTAAMVVSVGGFELVPDHYATVEPEPEVIARLERLSKKTRILLRSFSVVPTGVEGSLLAMEQMLARLHAIAEKELSNEPLEGTDTALLMSIGGTFNRLVDGLAAVIEPPDPNAKVPARTHPAAHFEGTSEAARTTLVADVHTDLNTRRVLEEAVGPIRWLFAVNRGPQGKLGVSVGPVFSHHELVQRLKDRLTDTKWRSLQRQKIIPPSGTHAIANGFELPCPPGTCERAASP